MRGRMVLALTVALLDATRRPLIEDGEIVGRIGPTVGIAPPEREALLVRQTIPEVSLPAEDRREGLR